MTETMIVEAVRAAGVQGTDPLAANGVGAVSSVADPSSVARFQAAMGANAVNGSDPVPFLTEVSSAWRSSQVNHQGLLHRIRALTEMREMHGPTSIELVELQYNIMNLSFQQNVLSKVADKSSNAIQTLIKNQ